MDPKACLQAAFRAFQLGRFDEAREHLATYKQWRRSGGFEPIDVTPIPAQRGDSCADMLTYWLELLPKAEPDDDNDWEADDDFGFR
jgi:hypothetical protein